MHKQSINRDDLKPIIKEGLGEIASMVKRTLGPGGLPIIIQRVGQALNGEPLGPKITKDGVSVAEECGSSDPAKNLIIQAVKHICKKTNATAGDGTTTAIVLGEALVNETLDVLDADPSLNPQLVKESLDLAIIEVQKVLKELAKPVDDMDIIKQVATISANGDVEIGNIIGDAFKAVGAEGVVTVDEGATTSVTLDIVEGYQITRGVEGRDLFFNNKDGTQFEAENCAVICYDGKLLNYTDLSSSLMKLATLNDQGIPVALPPVLIIANDFSNEVLTWLAMQKNDAGMNICPVRGQNQTTVRTAYYEDIACLTGGKRLGTGAKSLKTLERSDAGFANRVIADKYKCIIYDGQGKEAAVIKRVEMLNSQKTKAESPYDVQLLSDRIGALTGGIAKIGVGGATDFEIKEKYDRIEDALNAARAAIEEGIVPGGGATLFRIACMLAEKKDETIGELILAKALIAPLNQILENIGVKADKALGEKLHKNKNLVYNARTKEIVDFMEAGIIDPVKVTRSALENAASIASLLSTAGGGIIYVKD